MKTLSTIAMAAVTVMASFLVTACSAGEDTLSDAQIYAIYDQVNGFDIETAGLGAVKGHSPEVRKLAVMVLRDHSAVRQMARDIAADEKISYRIDEQSDGAKAHRQAMAGLKSKSGEAFDRAYLAHEEVFHTEAIAAIRTVLLEETESEAFKAHMRAVLPGFEHHLAETIRVAKELGYRND